MHKPDNNNNSIIFISFRLKTASCKADVPNLFKIFTFAKLSSRYLTTLSDEYKTAY